MKPFYFFIKNTALSKAACTVLIVIAMFNTAMAQKQTIQMPATTKQQKLIVTYKMDVFSMEPAILMNELIWLNKFTGENNYAEEIKYLRMAYEKIEFTYGQKEFRNMAEDKIYHLYVKFLPKLLCEAKVAHFDRNMKKKSVALIVSVCEEKNPGYVTITTQKGKVVFDCDGKYLPQQP